MSGMMRSLPTSPEQLQGLRAARWIRESTSGQSDNHGPEAQRRQHDAAIERYGMVDAGLTWEVTHSGYATDAEGIAKIASDPKYQDMMKRAGTDYDVLLIGYVSRANRNAELQMMTRRLLHNKGAVILACDERMLSTNPDWVREAADAEHYSAKLAVRIKEGQEAKWHRYSDPSGWAPLGYRRAADKPHLLEIDPDTIDQAITLYQRYALGNVSIDRLAASGIARIQHGKRKSQPMTREGIADVLVNPIYRGIVSYKGSSAKRADLRAMPDELWDRVQDVMAVRNSGGGPHVSQRVDLLAGILYCVCGTRVRSDGYAKVGKPRKRHPFLRDEANKPVACTKWGKAERLYAATWEVPIVAQVSQLDLSDRTISLVQRAMATPPIPPRELDRKRIERERTKLREGFDSGRISATDFVAGAAVLDQRLKALDEAPVRREDHEVSTEEAVDYLRALGKTWGDADDRERSDMLHSIYDRIEVAGPAFVDVKLRPEAKKHGLALALPEEVTVPEHLFSRDAALACPRGLRPLAPHLHRIAIAGRRRLLRSA